MTLAANTPTLQQNMTENRLYEEYAAYDGEYLQTKSRLHQFVDLQSDGKVIARFVKTTISMVSFKRQHPENKKIFVVGTLKTSTPDGYTAFRLIPEPNTTGFYDVLNPYNPDKMPVARMEPNADMPFRYADNVIELYEGVDDVERFKRMNKVLFDNETLIEYSPDIEYTYMDGELTEKQTNE